MTSIPGGIITSFTLLLCFSSGVSSETKFDFGSLTLSSLKLIGDAHLSNNTVRLTRDVDVPNSGAGKALYSKPVRFRRPESETPASFSSFFSFSVSNLNPTSVGGGLAFVITADDESVGDAGGYMGVIDAKGTKNDVVAVEFDTLMNVEFEDINGNHVGVDLGSMVSDEVADLDTAGVDLKSGNSVNSWIEYSSESEKLEIYVSYSNLKPKKKAKKCHNILCRGETGVIAGVFAAGVFVLCLAGILIFWVCTKKFKKVKKFESFSPGIVKTPKEFSYRELKSATTSFDPTRIIGHGAVGTVYRGILPESGENVAVKRCCRNLQGKEEFLSELSIIGTLRHKNLVKLQGWCHEKDEILLVYDLMPNGSLYKALYESTMVLQWPHRVKILLGVASALSYLHQECENQVIHRDIKTSNIMLDQGFNAKVGDFGLARQISHDENKSPDLTSAAGTIGYLAPEYVMTGRATEKSDVYSFGVVVLEVVSGRRPIERGVSTNLVEWVWRGHREGGLLGVVDLRLNGEYDEVELTRVLMIGLGCCHPDPMARPTMSQVVHMMLGETHVPLVPRIKPSMSLSTTSLYMTLEDSVSDLNNGLIISHSSSSENSSIGGANDTV